MRLSKEKIKQVLLDSGLSTRRSERLAENLASRDLMEIEDKTKGKSSAIRSKDIIEVSTE